ncbi:hypothetical protein DUNSADRAFT_5901 [Dunaliella salina]|uniref:PARP catalytic domain-containing protein n=1 Tax=Dunaliella salina TaxID=3046 RepID=A0ABQ7GPC4_DUNSA|nr:hypothetical protein DUNSADRAFT_5901 [Dunaliella salina]|eukprot:KAF5836454.1 hypothetical protein DUNSADRAFT_5901 [Dunaliella salina]
MRDPASLQALPQPSIALLAWLLLPETRKQLLFHSIPPSTFAKQLQQVQPGILPPHFEANQAPSAIFALDRPSSSTARRPVVAYHGTAMENLHSILNTGLINASGTRLQRTGAAFGDGIYLSTRHSVAYSFSRPSDSWKKSALGTRMRCLLVCEVDMDKIDEASAAGLQGSQSKVDSSSDVPDDYLLVSRTDAIRLLHVLLFCDAPPLAALQEVQHGRVHRPAAKINWCTVLVSLYALGMLLSGILANKSVQLQLKYLWRRWQQSS